MAWERCNNCREEFFRNKGEVFCPKCGLETITKKTIDKAINNVECQGCNNFIDESSVFCPKCGYKQSRTFAINSLDTIQNQQAQTSASFTKQAAKKERNELNIAFGVFIAFAIVVLVFAVAMNGLGSTSSDSNASVSDSNASVRIVDDIGPNDGPRDFFNKTLLEDPLTSAVDQNALTLAKIQGVDFFAKCSDYYTVRTASNCIYAWFMSEIGGDSTITVSEVKQQMSSGFTMSILLSKIFPANVYNNAVRKQILWLAQQDERNGILYSDY